MLNRMTDEMESSSSYSGGETQNGKGLHHRSRRHIRQRCTTSNETLEFRIAGKFPLDEK
jgi:hypothetical protein